MESMRRFDAALRWYPKDWRERYGDELVALLEDTYPSGAVPLRCRLSLMRAGALERLRGARRAVGRATPLDRVRSGSLLVLCAWAAFIVAGTGFAKYTEHWDVATPPGDRNVPAAAFDAVQWSSFLGALIVLVAAALCLPALVRLLRGGGWPEIRRPVLGAALVTAVAVVGGAGVVLWSHRLNGQRNNGGAPFNLGGVIWVGLICASIALAAVAVVAVVRRLDLTARVVRLLGRLALMMTVVMAVITGGTITWWASMARFAPGFLGSGPLGWPGSPLPPVMIAAGLLMVSGLGAALLGAGSIACSVRQRAPGEPSR
ncbi:MAG: hypothetical protein ACRDYE_00180 [Acidimicrobiales bacterium]